MAYVQPPAGRPYTGIPYVPRPQSPVPTPPPSLRDQARGAFNERYPVLGGAWQNVQNWANANPQRLRQIGSGLATMGAQGLAASAAGLGRPGVLSGMIGGFHAGSQAPPPGEPPEMIEKVGPDGLPHYFGWDGRDYTIDYGVVPPSDPLSQVQNIFPPDDPRAGAADRMWEGGIGFLEEARDELDETVQAMDLNIDALDILQRVDAQGDPAYFFGPLANTEAGIVNFGVAIGLIPPGSPSAERANNTKLAMQNRARQSLNIITRLGAGTGLSDADREYANNIAGNLENMTPEALLRLLEMEMHILTAQYADYQDLYGAFQEGMGGAPLSPHLQPPQRPYMEAALEYGQRYMEYRDVRLREVLGDRFDELNNRPWGAEDDNGADEVGAVPAPAGPPAAGPGVQLAEPGFNAGGEVYFDQQEFTRNGQRFRVHWIDGAYRIEGPL